MDKYTYSLKTDKIQKLVRQGDYITAAKIADDIDWKQENNVRLLNAMAEAYEKTKQYKVAIDVLLRAYDKSTAGKRILYKLTEMAIASGSIGDAETFYNKYLEEAPEDNNRYLLRFRIAEARDEDLAKQITILETYQKYEFEEEWACKLAELYQKAGRRKECVELCDKIILWFGVGEYVEKAMDLKETFEPLNAMQREHRENKAYYEEKLRQVASEMASGKINLREESTDVEDKPVKEEATIWQATPEENEATQERLSTYRAGVDVSVIKEELEKVTNLLAPQENLPEEVIAEEFPSEEIISEPVSQEDAALDETKDLKNLMQWKNKALPAEDNLEPTKEIVIPRSTWDTAEEALEEEEEIILPEIAFEVTEEVLANEAEVAAEESAEEKTVEEKPIEEATETEKIVEEVPETAVDSIPEEVASMLDEEEDAEDDDVEEVIPMIAFDETELAELEASIPENPKEEIVEAADDSESLENCIFVESNDPQEGLEKAIELLEEYYDTHNKDQSSVAKIKAERLNQRGLIRSLPQLNRKDLIIDEANGLSEETLREMLEVMDYLDTDKIFVFIDCKEELQTLKQRICDLKISERQQAAEETVLPEIQFSEVEESGETEEAEKVEDTPIIKDEVKTAKTAKTEVKDFENMSEDQVLTEDEFIRYAEYYAKELECVLDDSGREAIRDEMEDILQSGSQLTAGELMAIIEDAADQAEKPSVRRIFGSKYDKEGFLILRKKNFL